MFPFNQCQCFDKRRGVFLVEKVSVFIKIRVLFWPEISALGVFLNFDNERMRPPKYPSAPPPPGAVVTLNPSNAEATFVQSTRKQTFLWNIETLSCWYSLESSYWVLSDEYPCASDSVIFLDFVPHFVLAKLATSSIRVNRHSSHT